MFTSSIAKFLFILVRIQGELQANSETIGAEVQRRSRAKRDKKNGEDVFESGFLTVLR